MNLPVSQVWIRDQNRKIPNDDKVYVIIGMVDSKPYSAQSYMETRLGVGSDPEPYEVEITKTLVKENIQIDILSQSNQAILRKNEMFLAVNSFAAKQAQEKYGFKIARIPINFVNSSGAEGGSNINRFTLTIPCLTWYIKENGMPSYDYYDQFKTRVDDEVTIGEEDGLIEFEITPDTPDPKQIP